MIRASSLHRITTNRPFFDGKAFGKLKVEFKEKVEKKKLKYVEDIGFAEDMLITPGLKTIAEKIIKGYNDKHIAETDPLPPGAKTALQELYLDLNYGFYNMSMSENDPALKKGILVEDDTIKTLGEHLGLTFTNNKERKSNELGFLTGEADILHEHTVRDVKTPLNWTTFRKKDGIETAYHWQLVAYCLLYGKTEAYLDYVLMPMPEVMIIEQTKYSTPAAREKFVDYNHRISQMPTNMRIKTYQVEPAKLLKDMEFAKKRLAQAKIYYETLDYNTCMKMAV